MKKYRFKQRGLRIRESRKNAFPKQNMKEWADMFNLKYRTVQNWELGVCGPKPDTILWLANMFKVDSGWLLSGSKPRLADSTKALIEKHFPKEQR